MNLKPPEESIMGIQNIIKHFSVHFYLSYRLKIPFVALLRFFLTNPSIEGQPIDFTLLIDEQYKQYKSYQRESRMADEMGGQVRVYLQNFQNPVVHV